MSLTHQKDGSCMGKSTRAQFCALVQNLPITEYTVTILVYMEPAWVKVCKSNFRLTSLFAVIWSFGHLSKSTTDCQTPPKRIRELPRSIPCKHSFLLYYSTKISKNWEKTIIHDVDLSNCVVDLIIYDVDLTNVDADLTPTYAFHVFYIRHANVLPASGGRFYGKIVCQYRI